MKFTVKSFFTGLFLDIDKPSFSRVSSAVVLVVTLGLVAFETIKSGRLPDLTTPAIFCTGVIGVLYGTNRFSDALNTKLQNKTSQ